MVAVLSFFAHAVSPRRILLWGLLLLSLHASAEAPTLMLAHVYRKGVDVNQYWVSEKLDGVRARWTGSQLLSRNGNRFAAPTWFTDGFGDQELDGELWLGRGKYQQTVSLVRRQKPHDGWRQIRFMVFDLPTDPRPFSARVQAMQQLAKEQPAKYRKIVQQLRIADHEGLMTLLDRIIEQGGEGLMLHHQAALYRQGRSGDLLKVKRFDDAEAMVIGYTPGKGKYTGIVGSLRVRHSDGREFSIGSGLSDAERQSPPPIGSQITYQYQGLTDSGLPRFPVFLRLREAPP